ncbi:alginate lyase family protein [Asticcacaulis solisilvae]|uniref:alginate lyase family protein n=1 Tax=Asticcacaulis solisilvae TaxID=1217274 RepID=UPI003FD838DE
MRSALLAVMALALPLAAARSAHAGDWCSVSPAEAAQSLPAVTKRLQPLLDSQPRPMAVMHTEGTLPHQGIRDQSIEARKQLPIMRDAAYAWRAGAGDAYLTLSIRYFNAWAAVYQPNLNPIDETNFDAFFDTYAVIAPRLDPADRTKADAFLRKWGRDIVASVDAHNVVSQSPQAHTWDNNWQSHRVKIITMIAAATGDDALFNDARRLFQAQVAANIKPDGEVIDFAERDALHYVIYDLEPFTQAALAARMRGEDWFHYTSPTGSSVAKGFAWLYPYANGDTPHEEFKHSKVAFDAQRAAAGEKEYSGAFEPARAGNVFWFASAFEPSYLPLAQRLKPEAPLFIAMCGN